MEKKYQESLEILYSDIPDPVEGRVHACVDAVQTIKILPKPITKEQKHQTDEFIDCPQIPLFTPKKNGIDESTQIEEGDLFDFDAEIEPVLNTLLTKILDEARMEVLEEDEIASIRAKQRYFEEIRNREFMEVQRLDNAEIRRNQEIVFVLLNLK